MKLGRRSFLSSVFALAATGCRSDRKGELVGTTDDGDLAQGNAVDRFVCAARKVYAQDEDCRVSIVARHCRNNVVDKPVDNADWMDDKYPGLVRWVDVDGIRNVRDIGGWTGLKTGMVYRGTEMSVVRAADGNSHGYQISTKGLRTMREDLGIRTDFDLRAVTNASRGDFVTQSPLGPDIMLIDHPVGAYMNIYDYALPLEYGRALREFARKEIFPAYVHCAGGADRTGTLCFLLETLCGVSVVDATIDYELTSFSPVGLRFRSREAVQPFALVVRTMNTFPGKTFADKVAYWAEHVAGVTKSEISAIRANLK